MNIQSLVVRLLSNSSSFLKCVEGKTYNEKIQFAQMIIQDIYKIRTYVVEFLAKQKKLAYKITNRMKSYISRANVH